MKTFVAALALALMIAMNAPAQSSQTHPKPHKVKKHKAKKHRMFQ